MSDSVKGAPFRTEQPSSARGADGSPIPPDIDVAPTVVPRASGSGSPHDPTAARQRFINSLVGQRLGRYQIEAHIGTGGMGTVFLARDLQLDRDVALKVLPPEFAHDSTIVQRFRNEARAAAQLDHENIARVYDIGEDQGISYIAFEYVRGETIRDLVQKRGRLSVAETVAYTLQVASALAHADARGVVHRDIKPSNIIVTAGGRIKLVDMGLARFFEHQRLGGLTQTGVTLGTFDYIAPEQARDPRSADIRSDIYSLGCTMFHMLTGRPPFPDGNVVQKLLQHQSEPPPDVRELNPAVPRKLAAIIRKMMAKAPEDRYQTAADLITDLIEVASELRIRPVLLDGIPWAETAGTPSARWSSLLLWTASLLLLVGLVGFMFRSHLQLLMPAARTSDIDAASPADASVTSPQSVPPSPLAPSPPDTVAVDDRAGRSTLGRQAPAAGDSTDSSSQDSQPAPALQRVTDEASLRAAVAEARDGSLIELAPPDGIIELTPNGQGHQEGVAGLRIHGKTITIRGTPGSYPVLRLRYRPDAPDVAEWILAELKEATVTFEGIRFELVGNRLDRPMIAFLCDNGTLRLENCMVVDQTEPVSPSDSDGTEGSVGNWVIVAGGGLRMPARPLTGSTFSEQIVPATVTVHRSLFAGGHGFLWTTGPVRFRATDSAWLPFERTFLLTAPGYANDHHPVVVTELQRCTLTTTTGTLFTVTLVGSEGGASEASGGPGNTAAATITLTECVVAAYRPDQTTLLQTIAPAAYLWRGARNLYYGLAAYARSQQEDGSEARAETLWEWSRQRQVSETDSVQQSDWPWDVPRGRVAEHHGEELVRAALRLARSSRGYELAADGGPVGTRHVAPVGSIYGESALGLLVQALTRTVEAAGGGPAGAAGESPSVPMTTTAAENDRAATLAERPSSSGDKLEPTRGTGGLDESAVSGGVFRITADGQGSFRSLKEALERCPDGAVLELAVDGAVRLKPAVLSGKHVVVRAASGFRPVLTLDYDPAHETPNAFALLTVRRATLELDGVTIDLSATGSARVSPWTIVQLDDATLVVRNSTLRNEFAQGPIVELVQPPARGTMAELSGESPLGGVPLAQGTVTVERSVVLARGYVLRAPALAEAAIRFKDSAIAGGILLSVSPSAEPVSQRALLQLDLERCTVRTHRQLIAAQAKGDRQWLVPLHVTARRCLFETAGQEPWIMLRGTKVVDQTGGQANVFRWTGSGNAYAFRGPWLSLTDTQESHGQVSLPVDAFESDPYRSETDSAVVDIGFAMDFADELPAATDAVNFFRPSPVESSETTVGAPLDVLPGKRGKQRDQLSE